MVNHVDIMYALIWHNYTSVVFFHGQTQMEGHSTKYLISTLQKYQGHEKQGKPEKASEVGKDYGDMTIKCNMISWIGS